MAAAEPETADEVNPLADPEERRVLYAALDSFRQYRRAAHYNVTHLRRQSFYSLPSAHMDLLCDEPFSLPRIFDAVDEAIDSNAVLAEAILHSGLPAFGIDADEEAWKGTAMPSDMDKVRSTIRQFYRDWSSEGLPERLASYTPILIGLDAYLPAISASQRHRVRVLVPGAGLGRLVFDVCAAGYTVEGNEISYHQLLASHYVLNCTQAAGQHTVYPWALGFSNHLRRLDQTQAVAVPDRHPGAALEEVDQTIRSEVHFSERMSMTAGDFCVLYKQPEYNGNFDVVTTCFFIDTAPNVINYIETIKHCLKPAGLWINLGPLLWHFEATPTPAERERQHGSSAPQSHTNGDFTPEGDSSSRLRGEGIGEPGSFEFSDAEVVMLVERLGFDFLEHTQSPAGATGYIQSPVSMLQNVYRPSFWVGRKR